MLTVRYNYLIKSFVKLTIILCKIKHVPIYDEEIYLAARLNSAKLNSIQLDILISKCENTDNRELTYNFSSPLRQMSVTQLY